MEKEQPSNRFQQSADSYSNKQQQTLHHILQPPRNISQDVNKKRKELIEDWEYRGDLDENIPLSEDPLKNEIMKKIVSDFLKGLQGETTNPNATNIKSPIPSPNINSMGLIGEISHLLLTVPEDPAEYECDSDSCKGSTTLRHTPLSSRSPLLSSVSSFSSLRGKNDIRTAPHTNPKASPRGEPPTHARSGPQTQAPSPLLSPRGRGRDNRDRERDRDNMNENIYTNGNTNTDNIYTDNYSKLSGAPNTPRKFTPKSLYKVGGPPPSPYLRSGSEDSRSPPLDLCLSGGFTLSRNTKRMAINSLSTNDSLNLQNSVDGVPDANPVLRTIQAAQKMQLLQEETNYIIDSDEGDLLTIPNLEDVQVEVGEKDNGNTYSGNNYSGNSFSLDIGGDHSCSPSQNIFTTNTLNSTNKRKKHRRMESVSFDKESISQILTAKFDDIASQEDMNNNNWPRDPALYTFYTLGKSEPVISKPRFVNRLASSGGAAPVDKRNPHFEEDINIKPITQYAPQTEKEKRGNYLDSFKPIQSNPTMQQANMHNMQSNTLEKKKQIIKGGQNIKAESGKRIVNKSEFDNAKTRQIEDAGLGKAQTQHPPESKRVGLTEHYFYGTTRTEQPFRHKKAGITQLAKECQKYSQDSPEWFQLYNKKQNQKEPRENPLFNGTYTFLSKYQGWITCEPDKMDRKHPLEKVSKSDDATQTSKLMPEWMQIKGGMGSDNRFKSTVPLAAVRQEAKRTFMVEKVQPHKSVFSYQDTRHNVHSHAGAQEGNKGAGAHPYRIFEWKENVGKQKYDKPIVNKIGSAHEN